MRADLTKIFGEWVSFDKIERMVYSHDVANMPDTVEKMVHRLADAVVQPESVEQLQALIKVAQSSNMPLVPRGAATTGYGGVLPVKGGIVVAFTRMTKIKAVDSERMTVTVEPGVIWANLEEELHKHNLMLRLYPSSAPSATVGGWIAEGGSGIGSYEYGFVSDNLLEAKVVLPNGEVKSFSGSELDVINRAEGSTGFIVEATLALRPLEEEKLVLSAYDDLKSTVNVMKEINKAGLPVWHMNFATPTWTQKKEDAAELASLYNEHGVNEHGKVLPPPRGKYLLMVVYPASREDKVAAKLKEIIAANAGDILPEATAKHEWAERFYTMRAKNLGPSLIPSEAIVPLATIAEVVEEGGKRIPGIAIEATMAGKDILTILCFLTGDERIGLAYTLGWAKSLTMMEIAKAKGGRPYSTGFYFTEEAEEALGADKFDKIRKFKRSLDKQNLFNPGKIIADTGTQGLLRAAMQMSKVTEPLHSIVDKFLSHKPKMKRKVVDIIARSSFACAQCGYCTENCTLYMGYGWESTSPRGKFYILRQYLKGKIKLSQQEIDKFLMCTTCKRCDPVCQVNLPIMDLWNMLRPVLIVEKKHPTYPGFEMMGASLDMNLNIWAFNRENRDAWMPKEVKVQEKGEIGYWAGCTASFVTKEVAENAVQILNEGGVNFTYLGKDEGCCGIPMLMAGKPETFEPVFKNNMDNLKKRGIKKLIISCPGCYVAWTHFYPEWARNLGYDFDLEFVHTSEVIDELIQDGKLKFKNPVNKVVTWHDSCHLGRHGGVYDPPRNILKSIPGIEYREMKHCKDDALCCGSVLTRIGNPPVSDRLGSMRVQEAVDCGAEAMLATCPCCEVQLRVSADKAHIPMPVLDYTDVVMDALGLEHHDSIEVTLEAWSVFEKALEIMTRDGIVAMMGDMMPEIMASMPPAMQPMMKAMTALPCGAIQNAPLTAMEKMIPLLMPILFPGMMPKLMPKVIELMKKEIPNMPKDMEEMLPEMLPKVMAKIMPGMLGEVAPLLAPKMTGHMRKKCSPCEAV